MTKQEFCDSASRAALHAYLGPGSSIYGQIHDPERNEYSLWFILPSIPSENEIEDISASTALITAYFHHPFEREWKWSLADSIGPKDLEGWIKLWPIELPEEAEGIV